MSTSAGKAQVLADLRTLLGARATDAGAVCDHQPRRVVPRGGGTRVRLFPYNDRRGRRVVRISCDRGVPVVPFGAGTSLEGHVHAVRGGICLDLRQMNRVLRVSAEDMDATVEAGLNLIAVPASRASRP